MLSVLFVHKSIINSKFALKVVEKTVTSVLISAGNGRQGDFTVSAISGYNAIGSIGYETSAWETVFSKCILTPSSQQIFWAIRNTSNSEKTITLTFKILYIPTSWTLS